MRSVIIFFVSLLGWVLVSWLALYSGAVENLDNELILQLRMPRVILATAVGIGLAVAGAVLQVLFNNPLCEPYILGVSSGGALGAILGVALGFQAQYVGVGVSAFLGSAVFTVLLYSISLKRGLSGTSLLLAGVMLGFLGSSLVALWMALADVQGIQGALFWLLGNLGRAELDNSLFVLNAVGITSLYIWFHYSQLDVLLLGEIGATSVGLDVVQVRRRFILLVSLLVGICVSSTGMIGFVGLVIPHFVRRLMGPLHKGLLPVSAVWGAILLVTADIVSRTIAKPYELPVGVVTALIGVPLFFIIMLSRKERTFK